MSSITTRLREACVGHPHAKIPWPHRILHEAADEIERLRKLIEACVAEADERRPYTAIERLRDEIISQV